MVPLISGVQAGPLGIAHLPRLWFKMRAHAAGVLPEGYYAGDGSDDVAVLAAIGVDGEAFAAHLAADVPDYVACEAWVRSHATDLSPATFAAFNERHWAQVKSEPGQTEWLARFGLTGSSYVLSLQLNQLDDWDLVHAHIVARDAPSTPLVPAISSSVVGPLGAMHLPRLWLKQLLHAAGRLPEGYSHGSGLFDDLVSEQLGFDGAAFGAFVAAQRPGYLAAEAWVAQRAKRLDPETIAVLNAQLMETGMSSANDLDDWAQLHRQLLAIQNAGRSTLGLVMGIGVGGGVFYYQALVDAHVARGLTPELVMVHADVRRVLAHAAAGEKIALATYLAGLLQQLAGAGAQIATIPAFAPQLCAEELAPLAPLPLIDLLDTIVAEVERRKLQRIALFGARVTMETQMFGRLTGLDVISPRPDEIDVIASTYARIVEQRFASEADFETLRALAHTLIAREKLDAILLAGTDLAFVFNPANTDFPHLDGARVHLDAIMRYLVP